MNSSSDSSTVTTIMVDSSLSNSHQFSTSVSSPSPNRKSSSEISKAYKHASQLFLTRRFPEALSVLEPIISLVKQTNGYKDGEEEQPREALIVNATTTQRIKVWVLYITLLNSILDLGHDEGKRGFGHTRYKDMVNRVRSGEIWETVVRDGYGGRQGAVDAEVVYNLATLLLGQAPSQAVTQARLESYLATSTTALDAKPHLDHNGSPGTRSRTHGAETPRELTSHLKILEIFTLHVLPRNEEWEYARSFISMSDLLDDERRESFLGSLQELKNVKDFEMQEEELATSQEKDVHLQNQPADETRAEAEGSTPATHGSVRSGSAHKRTSSEVDYGIEKQQPNGTTLSGSQPQKPVNTTHAAPAPTAGRTRLSPPATSARNRNLRKSSQRTSLPFLQQVRNVLRGLQNLVGHMASSISGNPTVLLKLLLSVLAIIMTLSKREVRERARRIVSNGLDKVRNTVGMGVKVSYI